MWAAVGVVPAGSLLFFLFPAPGAGAPRPSKSPIFPSPLGPSHSPSLEPCLATHCAQAATDRAQGSSHPSGLSAHLPICPAASESVLLSAPPWPLCSRGSLCVCLTCCSRSAPCPLLISAQLCPCGSLCPLMPISLSVSSLCWVRLFPTSVCPSFCLCILALPVLRRMPSLRMAPGLWKDHPPKPHPRSAPFPRPRALGYLCTCPPPHFRPHRPPNLCRPPTSCFSGRRVGVGQAACSGLLCAPPPRFFPPARLPPSCRLFTSQNEVSCPAPALLRAPHDLFTCPPHQPLSKGTRSHQAPAT